MLTWAAFRRARPDLADAGRDLLYQVGVGLAFLATVRPDGGPRLHPFCPLLGDDALVAFIIASPKQRDLHRDGRYSLHSFPTPDDEDAFSLSGRARLVSDPDVRRAFSDQFVAERAAFHVPAPAPDHALFAFDVDACLLTRTSGHGDHAPRHEIWRSS